VTVNHQGREPTRVGLIIGQLTVGGAEHQLRELLRGIDHDRFAPIVYCLADTISAVPSSQELESVPLRIIGASGWNRARRLAAALRADAVQLVHSWLYIANTYACAARWQSVRAPLITSARNCKSQGWVHHAGNIMAFRSSARIIVNSRQVGKYIVRRYAAPRQAIDVVYNGVDTNRFEAPDRRDGKALTVVTAGRLVTQKNPILFVEAAARIRAALPETRFMMLGDGPLRPVVEAQIERIGMKGAIELAGERHDVEKAFAQAHLFWLTSSWEGLPNVVLEAMACGLPVIATDVGGTRELFEHGKEGFLARPDQVDDFVTYGLMLLRDPERRVKMGDAARRRAGQFSLSRMVDATQATYEAALRGGS
jgi:glycosyltransferase involved in cell wall biosynthesis